MPVNDSQWRSIVNDVSKLNKRVNVIADQITTISGGSGGVSDGDKGDINVTGTGATWTIKNGLSVSKLGNGDVDNTKLSYLNGVTSSIQTQLNNKISDQTVVLNTTGQCTVTGSYPVFTINVSAVGGGSVTNSYNPQGY